MKAPERPTFDVRGDKRDRGALVVSIIVHVALFVLISGMVIVPALDFLLPHVDRRVVPERVTFVQEPPQPKAVLKRTPKPPEPKSEKPPSGAPVVPPPDVGPPARIPIIPPASIPTGVAAPRRDTIFTGDSLDPRIVGRGGVAGLSPGIKDPRLLPGATPRSVDPAGPLSGPYRSPDSLVHAWIQTYWDSLARVQANAGRRPGDWTVDRDGKKYGVDQQWIYFGKFKLPTMLLAMLPISTTANPTLVERNRALESMRWEIEFQARRSVNEKGFTDAVKELRERKEREAKAKKSDGTAKDSP